MLVSVRGFFMAVIRLCFRHCSEHLFRELELAVDFRSGEAPPMLACLCPLSVGGGSFGGGVVTQWGFKSALGLDWAGAGLGCPSLDS